MENNQSSAEENTEQGVIAWFARNSVAANLLMLIIIFGGLYAALTIRKQMFPQIDLNAINVNVVYPGAAPQEVEEGITIKLEEALASVEGLERVITYSNRSSAYAYLQVSNNYDPREVLDEVKIQIDAISSFPDGMERPRVELRKARQDVLYLSLYGNMDQRRLKELGRAIHDQIQNLPLINVTEYYDGLDYEISIEVSKDKLREYNLSFTDIATAVRNFSANRSAGQIRAVDGYISLRVENQAYNGFEFESLPLINRPDGTQVLLGEVATVKDGFVDGIQYSKFNGMNAVTLYVGASKDQSITDIARVVKNYIEKKQRELPEGVELKSWVDMTYYLQGRLDMMLNNMMYGGVLVFLMLALFLRIRLAFWVMVGLPVCFLGTLMMMPLSWVDVTINVTSLFGFILVLGVVVDDAIVIGESVHAEIEKNGQSLGSVVRGAKRVAMPATFGVLTTVAAFLPMVLDDGPQSGFPHAIGFVVVFCLLFSLVESKLILPAHLAQMKVSTPNPKNPLYRLREKVDAGLKYFIEKMYRPTLERFIFYRYTVVAVFTGILIVSAGLYAGGVIRYIGFPKVPTDFPRITLEMNASSSENATLSGALKIQQALEKVDSQLREEYGVGMISDLSVDLRSRTEAQIMARLVDSELRPIDTFALSALWREAIPPLPGMKNLTIRDNTFGAGRNDGDVSFRLIGKDAEALALAAGELKHKLESLKGVSEVNDSKPAPADEVQFAMKPLAYSLGLSITDIAAQLNNSFYGLEAQRILRNGEEIKVMVRYPENERNDIGLVKEVLIKTPSGAEVPLSEVAEIEVVDGVNQLYREDGNRTITIWASVDAKQIEPVKVATEIRDTFIPQLIKKYPSVSSELAGRIQEEIASVVTQLLNAFLSLLVIYALLAVPLKSYAQPLIIMSVIPFGIIGSALGHLLLGMDLSMFSVMGIIATAGVVVNDSLVMVDFVNRAREEGVAMTQAVVDAGCQRFRAIMLTSVTTFIGLVPIISESSLQAKIVIPMAVSLAFGVLFATVITLVLIPCLYVVGGDIKRLMRKLIPRPDRAVLYP